MKTEDKAEIIYEEISDRLVEFMERCEGKTITNAYIGAFQIGIFDDIKKGIRKINR